MEESRYQVNILLERILETIQKKMLTVTHQEVNKTVATLMVQIFWFRMEAVTVVVAQIVDHLEAVVLTADHIEIVDLTKIHLEIADHPKAQEEYVNQENVEHPEITQTINTEIKY